MGSKSAVWLSFVICIVLDIVYAGKFYNRLKRLDRGPHKFESKDLPNHWFTQKLDHTNDSDNRTFQQYSGMLALWMRQKYPDLVVGAVGSSAPVEAQVDYYGMDLQVCDQSIFSMSYYQVVDKAFQFYEPVCAAQLTEAFNLLNSYTKTENGRITINKLVHHYITTNIDVYGKKYNIDYTKNAVKETNKRYGGRDNYKGTNVVIVNGNVDPWSAAGILEPNDDPSVVIIYVNGTTHADDIGDPDHTANPEEIRRAQAITFFNIQKWISEANTKPQKNHKDFITKSKNSQKYVIKNWEARIVFGEDIADKYEKMPKNSNAKHRRIRLSRPKITFNGTDGNTTIGYVEQEIDHFGTSNDGNYQQRFWYNDQFYKPDGPLFLNIDGEGEESSDSIEATFMVAMAQEHGAALFNLEHRYYGYSRPTENLSRENLTWLSSKQALADLAVFIKNMNDYFNYTNPKWVVFGGSYPGIRVVHQFRPQNSVLSPKLIKGNVLKGNLAAWFRSKYPELTVGAVASSAPIFAKVDYFEYNQVVERVLKNTSEECAEQLAVLVEQFRVLLNTEEGRKKLNNLSNACDPGLNSATLGEKDIQVMAEGITGESGGAVQFGNSKGFCDRLKNSPDYIYYSGNANDCNDFIYANNVNFLQNLSYLADTGRQWIWQTCTEFGYYQSTDIGKNIFGSILPINYYIDLCTDVYGSEFDRNSIDKAVKETLEIYGDEDNFNATNIVFPNGSFDPWSAAGYYSTENPSLIPILIDGASHCADMDLLNENSPQSLKDAQEQIRRIVAEWLVE